MKYRKSAGGKPALFLLSHLRFTLGTPRLNPGLSSDRGPRRPLVTPLSAAPLRLGRMINCLEGPGGKNFTVAAGNPCRGQGSGIFNDLRAASGNAKVGTALRFAEAAHGFALQGIASTDVGVALTYAWMVAFDLNNALDALR